MVNTVLSFPSLPAPFLEGLVSSLVIRNVCRRHRKMSTSSKLLENGHIQTEMIPTWNKDRKPCNTCDQSPEVFGLLQ